MKSIAFIVPYFGRFRDDTPLWLRSCESNPSVDWYLLTDDLRDFAYPANVHVMPMTFERIRERLQKVVSAPIRLESTYKLCDFKPLYGEAFSDMLAGYDYWGHCDTDMVWGNLRHWLTDDVLTTHDRLGFTGNCMVYRNSVENNRMWRGADRAGNELWRSVLTDSRVRCFDEVGMTDIYFASGKPVWAEVCHDQLAAHRYDFVPCFRKRGPLGLRGHIVYRWDDGRLHRLTARLGSGKVEATEIMFVHLMGFRKPPIRLRDPDADVFLITPDGYVESARSDWRFVYHAGRTRWARYAWDRRDLFAKPGELKQRVKGFLKQTYWVTFRNDEFNYWTWAENESDRTVGRLAVI